MKHSRTVTKTYNKRLIWSLNYRFFTNLVSKLLKSTNFSLISLSSTYLIYQLKKYIVFHDIM